MLRHRISSFYQKWRYAESIYFRIIQMILYKISELESLVLRSNEMTKFRHLFLKSKSVKFRKPLLIDQKSALYEPPFHRLQAGRGMRIGENAGIYVHDEIEIGENFLAAPGLTINNCSHVIDTLEPQSTLIKIGYRVWCGVNDTIIAGAKIGDDCVIGANSLVMHPIPNGSLAVGTPAKVNRPNIRPPGGRFLLEGISLMKLKQTIT